MICLALVMVLSLSVSSFAAGSFTKSPSGNPTPEIIEWKIDGQEELDCGAELVITSYADRDKLSDDMKETMEYAYDDILTSDDLTEYSDDLAKLAEKLNINVRLLAVSDLFNIHVGGCEEDEHSHYEIVLKADTLNQFVGLMNMSETGLWELVSDAEVVNNGEYLKFSVNKLGVFAIVVESKGDTPQTGENSKIYVYAAIMAVSALALIVVIIAKKRKQDKQ